MEKTLKIVGLLLTIRKEILTPTQALGSSGRKKEQERAREACEGDTWGVSRVSFSRARFFLRPLFKRLLRRLTASDQRSISDKAKIGNYRKSLYSTRPHDLSVKETFAKSTQRIHQTQSFSLAKTIQCKHSKHRSPFRARKAIVLHYLNAWDMLLVSQSHFPFLLFQTWLITLFHTTFRYCNNTFQNGNSDWVWLADASEV